MKRLILKPEELEGNVPRLLLTGGTVGVGRLSCSLPWLPLQAHFSTVPS
jgi:hypothetical protein